jgi:Zn-dependent M28 family amino/carboxypeptidase
MKYLRSFLFMLLILTGSAAELLSQKTLYVTADDLKSWVSYLASDQLRGRANGSPELRIAAEWIEGKFKEYGLKPVLKDGGFIQNYTYPSRQKTTINNQNVIGIIEGSDPQLKDQFIVLSAHFDHVGVRKTSDPDSIYNGADDNAAGTCTLIGIAKYIHDSGIRPGRTIVVTAFSGEENGMRGSRYFVANSPVVLKDIYADINFEMIGHSESYGKNNYYMTGCQLSNLDDLISGFEKNTKFHLIDTISMAQSLFYASDNIAFSRISVSGDITTGIPSGTFATSTMAPHVHAPSDEAKLFDFDNMAALVNHFSRIVIWLSESKSEINWTDPKFVRPK